MNTEPKIHQAFAVHKLNDSGMDKAAKIAVAFHNLEQELAAIISPECYPVLGREYAIATTKLEEASFFAKKALAIKQTNQQCAVKGE